MKLPKNTILTSESNKKQEVRETWRNRMDALIQTVLSALWQTVVGRVPKLNYQEKQRKSGE